MSFGNTLKDASGVPISTVYVPNDTFEALQGAPATTDGGGNKSSPVAFAQVDLSAGPTTISAAQPSINTPVANASVQLTLGQGQSSWLAQIVSVAGFTSASTMVVDQSIDGGTLWYATNFKVAGSLTNTPVQSVVGPGPLLISGDAASKGILRVRCSVLNSGETMSVLIKGGAGIGSVGLLSSIPTGTNAIGSVTVSNANANGQATMANSAPVALASDQGAILIKQGIGAAAGTNWRVAPDFTEQASLTAASLNADLVPSTDISAYEEWSIQVSAVATGGTLTFQGSNDNSTFVSVLAYPVSNTGSPTTAVSATGMWCGPRKYRYVRIRQTAWTSGTTTATFEAYASANYPTTQSTNANATQTGTWTVQPGNTQNTIPWLMAGPNANGTQAANTAANSVIKGTPGWLFHAIVTTLGTAGLTVYDNATTNSGTPLLVIPASAAVGTIYSFPSGARAVNGITSAGVTNCPAVTFHYT